MTINRTSYNILFHHIIILHNIYNITDTMRNYFLQLRNEIGVRIVDRVIDPATDKPSKVSQQE